MSQSSSLKDEHPLDPSPPFPQEAPSSSARRQDLLTRTHVDLAQQRSQTGSPLPAPLLPSNQLPISLVDPPS